MLPTSCSEISSTFKSAMKYIDCIETLTVSKNKIYGDIQVVFELYKFSNLKVLDISEQLVGNIPLLLKTDNRLLDSSTYGFPLPPKCFNDTNMVSSKVYFSNTNIS
jgi:hypothetical protein